MKFSEARQGRVFILRLEDGEIVHKTLEAFAREQDIRAAAVMVVGGAGGDSRLVVGPETASARPIDPMVHLLNDVHEVTGTGTLFPDENGDPILHLHMACGRGNKTATGCARQGVKVWQVMEVILFELLDSGSLRVFDAELGFLMLRP